MDFLRKLKYADSVIVCVCSARDMSLLINGVFPVHSCAHMTVMEGIFRKNDGSDWFYLD